MVRYETAHLNVHSLSRNTCNLNVTTATTTTVTTAITSAIYNYHWQFLIFHQNSLLNWWIYIIIVYKQGVTHNDKKGSHVTNKQNSQISLSLHFTYYYQHSLQPVSFFSSATTISKYSLQFSALTSSVVLSTHIHTHTSVTLIKSIPTYTNSHTHVYTNKLEPIVLGPHDCQFNWWQRGTSKSSSHTNSSKKKTKDLECLYKCMLGCG